MLKPYLETAFKGKQDKLYRKVSGPAERNCTDTKKICTGNTLGYESLMRFYWDNKQREYYKLNINGEAKASYQKYVKDDSELRLPIVSIKEDKVTVMWFIFHFAAVFLACSMILIDIFINDAESTIDYCIFIFTAVIVSKVLFYLYYKVTNKPKQSVVIFNRSSGNLEFLDENDELLKKIPFDSLMHIGALILK